MTGLFDNYALSRDWILRNCVVMGPSTRTRVPSGNVEDSVLSQKNLSAALVSQIRAAFRHTLIWRGGFTGDTAQAAIEAGWADLIAMVRCRPFHVPHPKRLNRVHRFSRARRHACQAVLGPATTCGEHMLCASQSRSS